MVPIHNGFLRPSFPATSVTTQKDLVSLGLFNVVVDNVIITWMDMTMEGQRLAHDGLVFYADDGMVGSRDLDCKQHSMLDNVAKSLTKMCQPGILWF